VTRVPACSNSFCKLQWSRRFTSGCDWSAMQTYANNIRFNGAGGLPPVVTCESHTIKQWLKLQWSRRFTSGCDGELRHIDGLYGCFNGAGGLPPVVTWWCPMLQLPGSGFNGAGGLPPVVTSVLIIKHLLWVASMEPEVYLRL